MDSLDDARNKWILPWPPASNQLIMRFYTTTDDSWRLWNLFSKVLWTNFSASSLVIVTTALQHNHQLAVSVIIFIIFQCKTDTCLALTGCWKIIITIDNLPLFIFSNYRWKFNTFWKWSQWFESHEKCLILQYCERSELRLFVFKIVSIPTTLA